MKFLAGADWPGFVRARCGGFGAVATALAVLSLPALAEEPERYLERVRESRSTGTLTYQVTDEHALIEGDMLIGRVDENGRLTTPVRQRGLAHSNLLDRWPDGIVPFEFDAGLDAIQRDKVIAAIGQIMELTRMSFVERAADDVDPEWEGVQFFGTMGCASYVGRAAEQPQPIHVENCTVGSIVHEIAHTIGLYHEHTRVDRDNHITIDESQIRPGYEHNFNILYANGQPVGDYDYGSIMHYGPRSFSVSDKNTIHVPDNVEIGQRVRLSDGDVEAIDRMYATDLAVTSTVTPVPANSQEAAEHPNALEIALAVSNRGRLGAHGLSLSVELGEDSEWLSISPESGWDCQSYSQELRCARWTMSEGGGTSFTVYVDPGSSSAEDLTVSLRSRTLDTDLSNNGKGANTGGGQTLDESGPVRDDAETGPALGAATENTDESVADSAPAAGEPTAAKPTAPKPAASGSAGGGAGGLALVAIGLVALRRRRRFID